MQNSKDIPTKLKRGFTLVELLVVIAILGLLMVIGLASFTGAQKNSRDGRRKADMKAMQSAFEQYYSTNNKYADCTTMSAEMPSGLPRDPQANFGDPDYTCSATAEKYCACATLERTGTGNAKAPSQGVFQDCNMASGGDYFCVSSLQ